MKPQVKWTDPGFWRRTLGLLPREGFAHWWWRGLTTCLPPAMRHLFAASSSRLIVAPQGGVAQVSLHKDDTRIELPQLDSQAPNPQDLSAAHSTSNLSVELKLPESMVLHKQLRLPDSVGENLRQVLGFEMDRLTPFQVDQVLYDCRVVKRDTQQQKLEIELALVRRDKVEPWLQALNEMRLAPAVIAPAGSWSGANLLPPTQRGNGSATARMTRVLWGLSLILIIAVLISPLLQKRALVEALGADLSKVRREANQVVNLRDQVEQSLGSARAVLDRRMRRRPVLEVLRDVTRLLPDDTWVQQLEFKGDTLQLRGESAQALGLIERLESSPLLQDVGFLSPVVQMAGKGRERFNLSARITQPTDRGTKE